MLPIALGFFLVSFLLEGRAAPTLWALARPAPLNFIVDWHIMQKKFLQLCEVDGFCNEVVHSMLGTFLDIIC